MTDHRSGTEHQDLALSADAGDAPESPARPSEALLIEFLAGESWRPQDVRVFAVTVGRAQLSAWAARQMPTARVDCLLLDLYQAQECRRLHGELDNLKILCQPDPPDGPFDVALLPLSAFGDGEWTRDLLQSVHSRLVEGGRLWASTDSPRDKWLRTELERLFDRVSAHVQKQGVVYVARKTGPGPRKKLKDYSAEFRFRDGERLLRVVTLPGVFSHRHLDTGARALIEKVVVRPGDRVADLGCGAGVVALAIAAREPTCRVTAVDSSARAVECTRRNAELNELSNIEVRHDADGNCGSAGAFDLVVGNPPYYSNHQIAAIFVDGARAALRPGGLLQSSPRTRGGTAKTWSTTSRRFKSSRRAPISSFRRGVVESQARSRTRPSYRRSRIGERAPANAGKPPAVRLAILTFGARPAVARHSVRN